LRSSRKHGKAVVEWRIAAEWKEGGSEAKGGMKKKTRPRTVNLEGCPGLTFTLCA